MPLIELGGGATTAQTTRTATATDSPDAVALGAPYDARAVTAADDASVIALLKAVFDQQQETQAALLAELRRLRVGVQLLLGHRGIDVDLETV
jgi:hypothetical protein